MAHTEQRRFFRKVCKRFPMSFQKVRALDCGSLNVNGTLRDLFVESDYVGVDIMSGPNVDVVSPIHEVPLADASFDTVVSAEMLEHDPYWSQSLQRMYALLKPGGLLVLSAAGLGRLEHGTMAHPDAGRLYSVLPAYYRNIAPADLTQAFDGLPFTSSKIGIDKRHRDIYFVGRKANGA